MNYKSLAKHLQIADSSSDRKNSERVGQYHVGKEAIYVPCFPFDKYIPFTAIKSVRTQVGHVHTTGCCGMGIPVVIMALEYYAAPDKVELMKLTLDKQSEADKILELLGL